MADPLFDMFMNNVGLAPMNQWEQHNITNTLLADRYENIFGGYNRKSKSAKGFHSAADIASRYPDRENELKILAALYQLKSLIKAGILTPSQFSPKDEFYDFLANVKGIDAFTTLRKSNIPKEQYADLLYQASLKYADPFGDTTR